jgi:hypothetical protein
MGDTNGIDRLVWMESWELDCCGDEFAVGDTVEWAVEPGFELPPEVVEQTGFHIADVERHHGPWRAGERPVRVCIRGRVEHITAVFDERHDVDRRFEDRRAAVKFDKTPTGLYHTAYVVRLSQVEQLWHSDDIARTRGWPIGDPSGTHEDIDNPPPDATSEL